MEELWYDMDSIRKKKGKMRVIVQTSLRKKYRISIVEGMVLSQILFYFRGRENDEVDIRARRLALQLDVAKSSVAKLISDLRKAGFLEKIQGEVFAHKLTEKGKKMLEFYLEGSKNESK